VRRRSAVQQQADHRFTDVHRLELVRRFEGIVEQKAAVQRGDRGQRVDDALDALVRRQQSEGE